MVGKRLPKGPTTVLLPLIGVGYKNAEEAIAAFWAGDIFRVSGVYREMEWRNEVHVARRDFRHGDYIHIKYKYVNGHYIHTARVRARDNVD